MFKIDRVPAFAVFAFLAAATVAVPAFAQTDLSGGWTNKAHEDAIERSDGPEIGDYTGLPINDAARMRADSWDAEEIETLEHLCQKHPADYAPRGPSNLRMWTEMDPFSRTVIAWHTEMTYMLPQRTIYMDGRPHPSPNALHTSQGFSTGEWEGDKLKVVTTHLKEGRIRRNGIPRSPDATLTEYWIRHHGILTLVAYTDDPAYLTEPLIRTTSLVQDENFQFSPRHDQCIPNASVPRPKGFVAFHLPGENPYLTEFASKHNIPVEAARGGAETMYPEYVRKLAAMPPPPPIPGEKK
jgi:hypothetical protein